MDKNPAQMFFGAIRILGLRGQAEAENALDALIRKWPDTDWAEKASDMKNQFERWNQYPEPNLHKALLWLFACRNCGSENGRIKNISTTGGGMSRWFNYQGNKFLSISCSDCGKSEFWDLSILETTDGIEDFMDFIGG